MRKLITALVTTGLVAVIGASQATPSIQEVRSDIEAFQSYFQNKFPSLSLEDYKDGVNALPQYAHRRANWEGLMDFPPFEELAEQGVEEWSTPFANGATYDDCFSGKPAGNQYPYVDSDGALHTIETDIRDCLKNNGEEGMKGNSQKMARLTIAYKMRANGQPVDIDYSSETMRNYYEKGRQFYWAKRGQLNFSCADCHVLNAGNQVRGDVLSAALGHGTGFPVYRSKWGANSGKKPLGTLHRRYSGCNKQVRAKNFKALGEEYLAVEVYETIMSMGVPIEVPSQRQ
ncbi:MAG: sulfur-oxidizing protein SoxA [Saprospiraceae bacterium]|jgi:sulfur-oxidizing protein SoxA